MGPKLFLITFDTTSVGRERYKSMRREANQPLPKTVYMAVDDRLRSLGTLLKPMHQVRWLLSYENAEAIRSNLRFVLRGQCMLIVEIAQNAEWAGTNAEPRMQEAAGRWLRRQFNPQELKQANEAYEL